MWLWDFLYEFSTQVIHTDQWPEVARTPTPRQRLWMFLRYTPISFIIPRPLHFPTTNSLFFFSPSAVGKHILLILLLCFHNFSAQLDFFVCFQLTISVVWFHTLLVTLPIIHMHHLQIHWSSKSFLEEKIKLFPSKTLFMTISAKIYVSIFPPFLLFLK